MLQIHASHLPHIITFHVKQRFKDVEVAILSVMRLDCGEKAHKSQHLPVETTNKIIHDRP